MANEGEVPPEETQEAPQVDVTEIKEQLQELFSCVFSKSSSLDADDYFQSHLTAAQGIPLEAFLQAPQILAITQDGDLVRRALHESKIVYLHDDDTVRAIVKPEQNTLILRDIPSNTPSDDIVGIFTRAATAGDDVSFTPAGIRADMNDTWFVTFASEAAARAALQAIQHIKFNDKRISARLKTTAPVKPIYTGHSNQGGNPSPPGSNGGPSLPSPGMYPPRGPQDFYGGPISPEFASPMGMIPPIFFPGYPVPPPGAFMPPMAGPGMPPMGYPGMMMGGGKGQQMQWSPTNQGGFPGGMMMQQGMQGPMGMGPGPQGRGGKRMGRGMQGNGGYGYEGQHPQQGGWGQQQRGNYPSHRQPHDNYNQGMRQGGGGMHDGRGERVNSRRALGSTSTDSQDPPNSEGDGKGMGRRFSPRNDGREMRGDRGDNRGPGRPRMEGDQRGMPGGEEEADDSRRQPRSQGSTDPNGSNNGGGKAMARRRDDGGGGTGAEESPDGLERRAAPKRNGNGGREEGAKREEDADGNMRRANNSGSSSSSSSGANNRNSSSPIDGDNPTNGGNGGSSSHANANSSSSSSSLAHGEGGAKPGKANPNAKGKAPKEAKEPRAVKKPLQPDFDLSADFPTLVDGEPSPTAAAAPLPQTSAAKSPVFGYAAALRRGPDEAQASTGAPAGASPPEPAPEDAKQKAVDARPCEVEVDHDEVPTLTFGAFSPVAITSPADEKPSSLFLPPSQGAHAAPRNVAAPAAPAPAPAPTPAAAPTPPPPAQVAHVAPPAPADPPAPPAPQAPSAPPAPAAVESLAAGLSSASVSSAAKPAPEVAAAPVVASEKPVSDKPANVWGGNAKRSFSEVVASKAATK